MPENVVVATGGSVWSSPQSELFLKDGGWAWVSSEFKYDSGIMDGPISELEYIAIVNAYNAHVGRLKDSIGYLTIISDSETALGRFFKETNLPEEVDLYWVKGHSIYFLNKAADLLAKSMRINSWQTCDSVTPDAHEKIMKLFHKHHK